MQSTASGGGGQQHQWQSVDWVNEAYQTIYQTSFGHIPVLQVFPGRITTFPLIDVDP